MMIRKTLFLTVAVSLMLLTGAPASAADMKCAECGMMVKMDSKFSAKINQGDATFNFCDIGDLFAYINRKGMKDARAEVRDYTSGAWIDARKAYYVKSDKKFSTPMGWGVAAFMDKSEAAKSGSVMDFDGASKALK